MATRIQKAVGGSAPFVDVFPAPVQAQRAPASSDTDYPTGQVWVDMSVSPVVLYDHLGGGTWQANQLTLNTDGTFAAASDSTASSSLAIKTYVDATAIAGAPDASEVTKGIAELANQTEAEAGTDDERIMTALKVTQLLDSGNHSASLTTLDVSGTMTFTGTLDVDTTGAISLDADTASNFSVAGAGIDLTLASAAGRVVINGEEAAADAIRLLSAAGGIDANAALQVNIATSQSAADAMVLEASAGGIDILASGASAGEDIDIIATGSSVNISASENVADAIALNASAGGIDITAAGAAGEDIDIVNTAGSIHLNAGEAVSDAVNVDSSGGFDLDAAGQINLASSQNAADAVVIIASAGGVDITATGAAGEDLDLLASGSSVNVTATEDDAGAIYIHANGGTSERIRLHSDQGTAADSVVLESDVGGITVDSGLAGAASIRLYASDAAGGMDFDCGSGGFTLDAASGAISLDSALASNFTVTGAADLTLDSTAGSVNISGGEAAADAVSIQAAAGGLDLDGALQVNIASSQAAVADSIRIVASAADGGMDLDSGTGGMTLDTTGAVSIDAAAASNLATSSGDLTVQSAGSLVLKSTEAATADSVYIQASGILAGITLESASDIVNTPSGSFTVNATNGTDITSTTDITLTAGTAGASAIVATATNGGIQLLAGGGAGLDTVITNTAGSISMTAGESASDAFNLTASGAASAMNFSAGTGGFTFDSGMVVNVTAVDNDASAYAVLGSDYVIAADTTASGGGALTLTLPGSPATGRSLVVYDAAGGAGANNITIDGNGNNIAMSGSTAGTKALAANYSSVELWYDGTIWLGKYSA